MTYYGKPVEYWMSSAGKKDPMYKAVLRDISRGFGEDSPTRHGGNDYYYRDENLGIFVRVTKLEERVSNIEKKMEECI